MKCCNDDCRQGKDCPVRYCTGWPRLDNLLNAIAYGATVLFLLAMTVGIGWIIWGFK